MTTLRDIGVAAAINIGLTILFLLSFVVLSLQPVNDRVYYAKQYIMGLRKGRLRASPRQQPLGRYFNLDFTQYMGLFEWAKSALRKTEHEIIQHAGLDSAVYLRIFLVGLKIFVPLMVLGMAVLVPVNVGAGSLAESGISSADTNTTDARILFSDIDKLSMSNVPNQSSRLWAHLVMAYVFTAWVCYILFMEYKSIAELRLKFLSDENRRPDQFTVMVLQVPDNRVQPLDKQVETYFRRNHPDFYLTHQMAYNANNLSKIVKERDKAENWLDYFQYKYQRHPATRPMTKTGFLGIFGEQVDAIDYYTARIEKLNSEAEEERQVVINDPKSTLPAAFVSFRNRWGATVCAQTQQNQDPTMWLTEWAPEPRDVYWANLPIPYVQLGFRRLIVAGIVFFTVFLYMIPITAVQSLANLEGLRRSAPALDGILDKSFVSSFVQGFLPGLVLKIFFWLLPHFIMFLAKFEGHLAISKLERRAAAKYYYFVVVNIFFGSILAGSAFQQLKTFLTSSSILGFINTLALSIPQKASFFITYIMVDGWSGPAGEILGIKRLVKYHIKNVLFCKTEKDQNEATSPGTISLDQTLPQLQLYFLMGLVYSVITPIIIPFIIVFMGFGFLVYRYQVINVYNAEYESAGAFWPHVHGRIIAALILQHVTLIGIFLIKGPIAFVQTSPGGSLKSKILRYVRDSCSSTPFMIALPIVTLVFNNYCKKRFEAAFKNYPLESAMEKDMQDRRDDPDFNLGVFLRNAYNHPAFSDELENADVEKGQAAELGIVDEDEKTALQDSLPAGDGFGGRDGIEVERDSSPLLQQPTKSAANQDPSSLNPSVSLRRRASSTSGTRRDQEDSVRGGYHSARSHFDSGSTHSVPDGGSAPSDTDSSGKLTTGRDDVDETATELKNDADEDAVRTAYLQGYLRGQLSRENSSPESSPLIFRTSQKEEEDESVNIAGSPLEFKRGVLYERDVNEDEIISATYLQGYLKGQLSKESSPAPSFTDSPGSSPLTFRTGRFGPQVDTAEPQSSPLRGASPLSQMVPRAQTMSTIREASEMGSGAQRGRQLPRAQSLDGHPSGSPLSKEGEEAAASEAEIVAAPEVSRPARGKALGSLREVIYLDSPSFVRPNPSRARTLATMLKEPQGKNGRGGGPSKGPIKKDQKAASDASTSKKPKVGRANSLKNLMKNEGDDQPPTTLKLRKKKRKQKGEKGEKSSTSSSSSSSSSTSSSSSSSDSDHDDAARNSDSTPLRQMHQAAADSTSPNPQV